jgi:transcriptional regulator NrdR family protein
MIKCPKCGGGNTLVFDSRPREDTQMRKRRCEDCKNKFKTYEMSDSAYNQLLEFKSRYDDIIRWLEEGIDTE